MSWVTRKAPASGEHRVTYEGKTVEYHSVAGLDRLEERYWREIERHFGVAREATETQTKPERAARVADPEHRAAAPAPAAWRSKRPDWLGGRQKDWLRRG